MDIIIPYLKRTNGSQILLPEFFFTYQLMSLDGTPSGHCQSPLPSLLSSRNAGQRVGVLLLATHGRYGIHMDMQLSKFSGTRPRCKGASVLCGIRCLSDWHQYSTLLHNCQTAKPHFQETRLCNINKVESSGPTKKDMRKFFAPKITRAKSYHFPHIFFCVFSNFLRDFQQKIGVSKKFLNPSFFGVI